MRTFIDTPPRTMMEVYKSLPEGTLAELIENVLYMSPSPIFEHHNISKAIFRKLLERIEDTGKGTVFTAPFDVYLDEEQNAVQPDLIVVLKENTGIIDQKGHIHGVPDLLVEILSEGNKNHDLVRKKALYEQFGVKEYWIVDPTNKRGLIFQLQGKEYVLVGENTGTINSPLLKETFTF